MGIYCKIFAILAVTKGTVRYPNYCFVYPLFVGIRQHVCHGKEGAHNLHKLCEFPRDGQNVEMTAFSRNVCLTRLPFMPKSCYPIYNYLLPAIRLIWHFYQDTKVIYRYIDMMDPFDMCISNLTAFCSPYRILNREILVLRKIKHHFIRSFSHLPFIFTRLPFQV
jgi:hypothetical protein